MKTEPADNLFRDADRVPAPDLWHEIQRRPKDALVREPLGRRLVIVGLAFGVAAVGIGFAATVYRGVTRGPGPRESLTVGPAPETATGPVRPHLAGIVPVASPQDAVLGQIAVGEGGVWVGLWSQGKVAPDSIVRIDPVTNAIVTAIPLAGSPSSIAIGDGSVWVDVGSSDGSQERLDRIDPDTNSVVASIPIGYGRGGLRGAVAVGEDAVWAWSSLEDGSRALFRIDPATDKVVATVPLGPPPHWGTFGDGQVLVGGGVVWVLDWNGDLLRVDPSTNEVVDTIPLGGFGMILGEGLLWVDVQPEGTDRSLLSTSYLQRVDATTGRLIGKPFPVRGGEPSNLDGASSPLAVDGKNLWVDGYSGQGANITIARMDLETGEVVDSIRLPLGQSPGIAFDGAAQTVWVNAAYSTFRVGLRDPEPAQVEPTADQCPLKPEGGYEQQWSATSGAAGSVVTVSGAVPHYSEDGSYGPGEVLQWWWNVDPTRNGWALLTPGATEEPPAATPGAILLLGEANPRWACTYEATITIPPVPPGSYTVIELEVGGGGAAVLGRSPVTFVVTSPS